MYKTVLVIATLVLLSCKTTTYFIVRHAEKETATTMTADVPLSAAGKQRAEALKERLKNEHIQHIYSTNFLRTRTTAQPLADLLHLPVEIYEVNDSAFIHKLRAVDGNVLIVGHSNTVDDLVNGLTGRTEINGDLPDPEYGDLFVVRKKGNQFSFEKKHFGK